MFKANLYKNITLCLGSSLLLLLLLLIPLSTNAQVTEELLTENVFLPLISNNTDTLINNDAQAMQPAPSDEATDAVAQAAAIPSISLRGPMTKFFGIKTNLNHGWITNNCGFVQGNAEPANCGNNAKPYKAQIDGPMNPYRYGGNTYFQISHSENYRIKIPNNNWGNRASWVMEGDTMPSARQAEESFYNNRHWIFSVYNLNGALYALTHHEWYANRVTVGGVPGFLNGIWWIDAIGWAKSTNGGASWQMKPTSDGSKRLIIVPQPSDLAPTKKTFGFAHPSNIVWDTASKRYYFFASNYNYSATGVYSGGVVLLRTSNIDSPTGWQFWNGNTVNNTGWTDINHNTYQGNFGPQRPYVFWPRSQDGATINGTTGGCSHLYALNVRQHRPSGKWIVLGTKYCNGKEYGEAVFSWTKNIASPIDLAPLPTSEPTTILCSQCKPGQGSPNYFSFFDVDGSADDNYQYVGNKPLLVSNNGRGEYWHQFLTLTGF